MAEGGAGLCAKKGETVRVAHISLFCSNFAAFVPGDGPESNDQWLFLPDTKSSGLYLKDFWIHCG